MRKSVIMTGVLLFSGLCSLFGNGSNERINHKDGIALRGYDPVAYFTEGAPVKGDPGISYSWQGVSWQFSSEEHKDLFVANAEKYAPAYGGYCAWAMADGNLADADPQYWYIHDGTLYLNYNKRINEKWLKDIPDFIEKADDQWPDVKDTLEPVE